MGKYLFIYLAVLFIVAVLLREDFIFTLIYLLFGIFILSRLWIQRSFAALSVQRHAPTHLFLGEQARVRLEITNRSLLPIPWLLFHESLPLEIGSARTYRQVISVRSRSSFLYEYWLDARRRGYYPIGPLTLYTGDIFGVVDQLRYSYAPDYLIVYPKIIPLTRVTLTSQSPLGTLRHTLPIFEDPSRVIGKRDYTTGDSLRRVDWKASAASGRMQVKNYEPSIALETEIILNLHVPDYNPRHRYDNSELGIVVAASLANWVINQRQSVGLVTNGVDPLGEGGAPLPVPPRSGRSQLIRILEVLARVESDDTYPLVRLLWQQRLDLPWGATQILITPAVGDEVFDALFQSRRSGLGTLIVLIGAPPNYRQIQDKAGYFGFPLVTVENERDLDIWRK